MEIPDTTQFEERPIDWRVANSCIARSARQYRIHPLVVKAVALQEAGKPGTVSRNTNDTFDLGIMQVNSDNLPFLKKQFPWVTFERLANNACENILVGTYFLRHKIDAADSFWQGVGNYHSGTPKHHKRYMSQLIPKYKKLVAEARDRLRRIKRSRRVIEIR